jgi:hypothetical protein
VEIDGNRAPEGALQDAEATLVSFCAPGHGILAPRPRRHIADSPRMLARAAPRPAEPEPPR